jgi:hypothetical protein
MIVSLVRRLVPFCLLLAFTLATRAAEPPIIAKARAYIGAESALNAVRSIHYTGTLTTTDATGKEVRAALEIIFQKPAQQRITATSDKTIETTALDDYDGWQRVQEKADATKWRETLLGADQIRRLRANTWENLAFFRGIERAGGRCEDQGPATIDGVACEKLAFIHAPNIIFYRFFDQATGRLVYTETEGGGAIREKGELTIAGIRFPKSIITTTKDPKGSQVVTVTFDKIAVNESFAAGLFRVPALSPR